MNPRKVLLIDRQDEWRKRFTQMLTEANFLVEPYADYDYPVAEIQPGQEPDLVILSCSNITQAEIDLIQHMLTRRLHLVVLSSAIPWQDMRRVFLAGADDVVDKPYTQSNLVNIVEEALTSMTPLDSFQSIKREGIR